MVSVLSKVEQNGPDVEVHEAELGAAFVTKFSYLMEKGWEFKQPTVLSEQAQNEVRERACALFYN